MEPLPYAELHCHSNFSFLDGTSSPGRLVEAALAARLPICAITDHNGFYGVVNFAASAKGTDLATVFGAELSIGTEGRRDNVYDPAGEHLVVLARNARGYASLSAAISKGQMAKTEKGVFSLTLEELASFGSGDWAILSGCRKGSVAGDLMARGPRQAAYSAARLAEVFGRENFVIECWDHGDPVDSVRNDELVRIADSLGLRAVATNNVHYATRAAARLHATVAAIRANATLDEMDPWLASDQMAYLRSPAEQHRLFARYPGLALAAYELGRECAFDLSLVAPSLPDSMVPAGRSQDSWLRELAMSGAVGRYGEPTAERVPGAYAQIERELRIIAELGFAGYFLIVHDIVEFCRRSGIFCQGRGSAANSAVCYALGITNVDPVALGLLFERFLSPERDGPPDIDVDIESGRREEAIQYVYSTYGRERAAQVANVITYRARSAIRDVGRVFGYTSGVLDAWSKGMGRHRRLADALPAEDRRELAVPELVASLAAELEGAPRHLGIHTGGMVICDRPVVEVCPVEWARREGRSVLQWDKDDCAIAGLVKFDLLGLGMLEALHRMVDMVREFHGEEVDLALIPQEDEVYEMLQAADTVGVFQVESRAQMATLPRLRPTHFYDVVVEVALIRPGPIQGGSVHPYIRRRNGLEKVTYAHPLLERSLAKTLGVPLFQEQLMQMAMDVAGFTPGEADQLRQAMGSKRSNERMEALRARLFAGMEANGITGGVAEEIYEKLRAFANFGFPESHSASFAYLVYASAWFKLHYPAAFYASIINSQPMGFWSPETLSEDAKRHGVRVLAPEANRSGSDCTLEAAPAWGSPPEGKGYMARMIDSAWAGPAMRIGLAQIRGIGEKVATRIAEAAPFASLADLAERASLSASQLEALAKAGALSSLGAREGMTPLSRRQAVWVSEPLADRRIPSLPGMALGDEAPELPSLSAEESTYLDIATFGISPEAHPFAYMRKGMERAGVMPISSLPAARDRSLVRVAGVVTHRQRPRTAKGTTFISLEDETGLANVIVVPDVWECFRRTARMADALIVAGRVESHSGVVNVIASSLEPVFLPVGSMSRDFR